MFTDIFQNILLFQSYYTTLLKNVFFCKHWLLFCLGMPCAASSVQFSSVTQSCLILWRHGLQHARLFCPSPTPGAYSNSCPLHQWCHPTISSSVIPFYSWFQSFPALGSSPMSQFFISRWPKYGSFSFSISLPNEYSGQISFRMDWSDFLAVQGTLKSLQHHSSKASILQCSASFTVQLSHPYTLLEKP